MDARPLALPHVVIRAFPRPRLAALLLVATPLLGCGGGAASPAALAVITPANREAIAAAGVKAAFGLRRGMDPAVMPLGLFGSLNQRFSLGGLAALLAEQVGQPSGVTPCDGGGEIVRTYTDVDAIPGVSDTDTYDLEFLTCTGAGTSSSLEGTCRLEVSRSLYEPAELGEQRAFRAVLDVFQTEDPGGATYLSGDAQFFVGYSDFGRRTYYVGQRSQRLARDGGGEFLVLSDARLDFRWDEPDPTGVEPRGYSWISEGRLESSAWTGAVEWATDYLDEFVGFHGDWPFDGVLRITGANGGGLEVRATGTPSAEVSWDLDGDGVPEGTTLVPWTALLA